MKKIQRTEFLVCFGLLAVVILGGCRNSATDAQSGNDTNWTTQDNLNGRWIIDQPRSVDENVKQWKDARGADSVTQEMIDRVSKLYKKLHETDGYCIVIDGDQIEHRHFGDPILHRSRVEFTESNNEFSAREIAGLTREKNYLLTRSPTPKPPIEFHFDKNDQRLRVYSLVWKRDGDFNLEPLDLSVLVDKNKRTPMDVLKLAVADKQKHTPDSNFYENPEFVHSKFESVIMSTNRTGPSGANFNESFVEIHTSTRVRENGSGNVAQLRLIFANDPNRSCLILFVMEDGIWKIASGA